MAAITFEEVVQLAEQLTPEEQAALARHLLAKGRSGPPVTPTREQMIAELAARRAAGAFENVESLRGKYARPDLDISEEELRDYLHEVGTEWEEELDELFDDED